jgi:hypothetical protein
MVVGRSFVGAVTGLGILSTVHAAMAEPGDSGVGRQKKDPGSSVAVEFRSSEEPLSVEAYAETEDGRGPSLGRCRTPCRLTLPKGKYSLDLFSEETLTLSHAGVSVTEASRVWVTPESPTTRTVGLTMTAVGVAAAGVGIGLVASWHCTTEDMPGAQTHCSHDLLVPGLVSAFTGPLLAAVGLMLALDSGGSAEARPIPSAPRREATSPRASIAISGSGVGFRLAF